jgi:hypothetical protein
VQNSLEELSLAAAVAAVLLEVCSAKSQKSLHRRQATRQKVAAAQSETVFIHSHPEVVSDRYELVASNTSSGQATHKSAI